MCLIKPYYYRKIEDEINCIMKIKGPFMIVVSLNEVVKHPLFKQNFDIGIFLFKTKSISILFNKHNFHDSHAIKVAPHRQM
jgi:hypothetical protein